MSFVYILQCANGRYYIGSTNDIQRRLAEHRSRKTKSLRHLLPVELIFKQEFPTSREARAAERKLKKFKTGVLLIGSCGMGKLKRAYSKTALRFHGMEEVGVQFPVGPQIKLVAVCE